MLPAERQEAIMRRIEIEGVVRTLGLAREFKVTDETIRKDLEALAAARKVLRIHGGASRSTDTRHDLPLPERTSLNRREKAAIAREACKLIQPRDTVFFDASSTVLMMADFMGDQAVTVLTNAHHVVVALGGRANCDLICTGGNYEERSRSYVGPIAEEALRRFVIRWMFVGVDGLHSKRGASEVNPGQAILKERVIPRAENVCVVCDRTKLERTSPFLFAQLDQLDVLVTDEGAPGDVLRRFEDQGVRIILAPLGPETA
jgi:DeoR/GlpR family transcriptional regulator of sugar metabolism